MSCACESDLRTKILNRHGTGPIRLAWTDDWVSTRGVYQHEHVILSRNMPDVERAACGWALCACKTGHTRLGGGWAVVFGRNNKALQAAYDATPDPHVILLIAPGARTSGGAVGRIVKAAEASGRTVHVEQFEDRRSVVLVRGADSY